MFPCCQTWTVAFNLSTCLRLSLFNLSELRWKSISIFPTGDKGRESLPNVEFNSTAMRITVREVPSILIRREGFKY
jgi:hypothetical protein